MIGELACGNFKDRESTLFSLRTLPLVPTAEEDEAFCLLETYRLWGTGLGWVDVNLLASTAVSGARLMTVDAALRRAAAKVGVPLV